MTGTTQVLFVLGDPIAQVQAPTLLNRIFQRGGTDAVVVPLHVDAAGLGPALDGLKASPHPHPIWRPHPTPTLSLGLILLRRQTANRRFPRAALVVLRADS